jgi:hypothetical protein
VFDWLYSVPIAPSGELSCNPWTEC